MTLLKFFALFGSLLVLFLHGTVAKGDASEMAHCRQKGLDACAAGSKYCVNGGVTTCVKPGKLALCICPDGGVKLGKGSGCTPPTADIMNPATVCEEHCNRLTPKAKSSGFCGKTKTKVGQRCFCSVIV